MNLKTRVAPHASLLLFTAVFLTSAQANAGMFLQDQFDYPDGQLSGNAGWSATGGAQSLLVAGGKAVSGATAGEYNGFRSFSRAGALNDIFTFSVDIATPTHNSVASIVLPNSFAQVGGWTYESTGWRFGAIQSGITSGVRATILFDPIAKTMTGSLLDLGNGASLFQSAALSFNSQLESQMNVYLYADSRANLATTQFDNLSVTSLLAPVPEPTAVGMFGIVLVATAMMRRRRR